jgi:methyl-accepting chemotaxis protein
MLTQEITTATNEQHTASSQALESIGEIGIVASQNAVGSNEITTMVGKLEILSKELNT